MLCASSGAAQGTDRADRWGIFVGRCAPTLFGLGNALRTYEKKRRTGTRSRQLGARRPTARIPDR
jgi:hypothetical protein